VGFSSVIKRLIAAGDNPARQALAVIEIVWPDLSDDVLNQVQESLFAAAIPHWFDERILAQLLNIPKGQAGELFARLREFRFVEPFPARGEHSVNVHQATRLALRSELAKVDEPRFRMLSRRAADMFADANRPSVQIEWIYHLLCADPNKAVGSLEQIHRDWLATAKPEKLSALVGAVTELVEEAHLEGRALGQALNVIAWEKESRGDLSSLDTYAQHMLELGRETGHRHLESLAHALAGSFYLSQGDVDAAMQELEQDLRISIDLVAEDPRQRRAGARSGVDQGRNGQRPRQVRASGGGCRLRR